MTIQAQNNSKTIPEREPDIIITGANTNFYIGYSISNAGDVNGDGYDDIIVGSKKDPDAIRNYIYIHFGGTDMNNNYDLFIQSTPDAGFSVSSAGDINGDGYDDIILGDYGYDSNKGRALIYYGGENMDAEVDIILYGLSNNSKFGHSVSNAGDVNNDGYDDVIVGAYGYSSYRGRAYIYYGGVNMNTTVDVTLNSELAGSQYGCSVASAGDVNADGYSDVIVGAQVYGSGWGKHMYITVVIQWIILLIFHHQVQKVKLTNILVAQLQVLAM